MRSQADLGCGRAELTRGEGGLRAHGAGVERGKALDFMDAISGAGRWVAAKSLYKQNL